MDSLFSPAGVCDAWQSAMYLKHKLSEFALDLINDILVLSTSAEQHKQHLDGEVSVPHGSKFLN